MRKIIKVKSMHLIIAVLMGILVSGCASNQPMKIALTEMGTTSDSEYGAYGLRMLRAVNITGLGPEEVVGTETTDPDKWSIREQLARFFPVRNDLPDIMSPRITQGDSMIVERRFCSEAKSSMCPKLEDLTNMRVYLQIYQAKIAATASIQLKYFVFAAAKTELDTIKENDPDKNIKLKNITDSLALAYPEEDLSVTDDEGKQDAIKGKVSAVIEKLNTALKNENLESLQKDAIEAFKKPGIIVTNWEREVSLSGSADAAVASGSFNKKRKIGGFLILGDPRITSLQLGDDLRARGKPSESEGAESLFRTHRNYITYYQLRAKYVVFAETYNSSLQASLQADIKAIIQKLYPLFNKNILFKDKLNELQAKITASYASITSAGESGVLDASGGFENQYPFNFKRDQIRECVRQEMSRAKETLPIISIRASFDDLLKDNVK